MTFRLRAVHQQYDGRPALAGLDLDVADGRTTVLIGPSGCGKSTVLRVMIGLVTPDAGEVSFDGEPVVAGRIRAQRRRMGYVIQDGGLFPHLTARHNVTLMARHLDVPAEQRRDRLAELTALTQFPADHLDRYPLELSGGQRQRVSLMRALMLDPEVLLLDEPLGALDPMVRADLQEDLRRIFQALQKTVVLVTHDLAEAAYFADTVVLMREGRVVQQGPITELLERPRDEFVTRFVQAQRRGLAGEDAP